MSNAYEAGSAESSVELFVPTPALRKRLGVGMWAALAYGGLELASTLTSRPQDQGVTLALVLEWISLVPLIGVVWAYVALAHGVGSTGLRKSTICAFGMYALGELQTVGNLPQMPAWVGIVALVAAVLGLLALLIYLLSSSKPKEQSPAPTQAEETSSTGSKAGWVGVGTVLIFVLFKVGAKMLVAFGIKNIGPELFEVLMGLGLIGGLIAFVIWFAVCKIRLRGRLGGMAALVGWVELLLLIGVILLMAAMIFAFVAVAIEDPDNAEKAADAVFQQWLPVIVALSGVGAATWSVLTAWLFATLRSRQPAEDAAQF